MLDISDLRKDFSLRSLNEQDILSDPIKQFEVWFNEAILSKTTEPNAMTLSTTGKDMRPSARIVLLKQANPEGFVFFTNYESRKAQQLQENPYCSLTFVWHELERQVRIEGLAEILPLSESDNYFEQRPIGSKLGAWASPQSKVLPNREYLENLVQAFENQFKGKEIPRPANWGGYIVKPTLIEFWQGRPSRLHDRIQYSLCERERKWEINRLAP